MMTYSPFWQTLKNKGITSYALRFKHNISNGTLGRMRQGKPISTTTIEQFCKLLDCRVEDIVLYVPDEEEEKIK